MNEFTADFLGSETNGETFSTANPIEAQDVYAQSAANAGSSRSPYSHEL